MFDENEGFGGPGGPIFDENEGFGGPGGPLGGVLGPSGSKGDQKLVRGTLRGSQFGGQNPLKIDKNRCIFWDRFLTCFF